MPRYTFQIKIDVLKHRPCMNISKISTRFWGLALWMKRVWVTGTYIFSPWPNPFSVLGIGLLGYVRNYSSIYTNPPDRQYTRVHKNNSNEHTTHKSDLCIHISGGEEYSLLLKIKKKGKETSINTQFLYARFLHVGLSDDEWLGQDVPSLP